MKRFFAFILTVVMALSLVACGGDSTSDSSDSDAVIPDGEISLRIGTSASDTSAITQGNSMNALAAWLQLKSIPVIQFPAVLKQKVLRC